MLGNKLKVFFENFNFSHVLASVVLCFFISLAPFHTQRLLYVLQDYRLIIELHILKNLLIVKFIHSHQAELGV